MFICVHLWIILLTSCTTTPTDLRTLVPAETLVYLETNDLAAALQPIVDSKPFREVAKTKPDFSALKGVQVAVAVTGFETSEVAVTDEQAIGKVQPRFVAVANTHAWNFQAVAFAERKLGSFVAEIYDAEPKLEKSDKHGGKYFTWTSLDGRKAFALVIDSLIYFGNDESAIDKTMSVRNGQADSIAKTGKLPPHVQGNLASGYVSTDGVAQIAALAGLHFASQASDEEEIQSAIAGILPQLIRGTVTDISWSTSQTSEGIEDKWSVTMPADVAEVFNETMAPAQVADSPELPVSRPLSQIFQSKRVPTSVYKFKDPALAWRSLVSVAQRQINAVPEGMSGEFVSALLEQYGIRDTEGFLSQAKSPIITMVCDENAEEPFVAMEYGDIGEIKRSIESGLTFRKGWPGMIQKIEGTDQVQYESILLTSPDTGAFYNRRLLAVGNINCVEPLSERLGPATDVVRDNVFPSPFDQSQAPIISLGIDKDTARPLVQLLSIQRSDAEPTGWSYFTETRFTKTGMDRRTVSDVGFIGWMLAQLASE